MGGLDPESAIRDAPERPHAPGAGTPIRAPLDG